MLPKAPWDHFGEKCPSLEDHGSAVSKPAATVQHKTRKRDHPNPQHTWGISSLGLQVDGFRLCFRALETALEQGEEALIDSIDLLSNRKP